MSDIALNLLWEELLRRNPTEQEFFEVMKTIPKLSERAAEKLLDFPGRDNLRSVVYEQGGNEPGREAARRLLDGEWTNEEDRILVIKSIPDGPEPQEAARDILASDPSADTLATIVDEFEADSDLWKEAAFLLVDHQQATLRHLNLVLGKCNRRSAEFGPLYSRVIRNPNVDPDTVGRVALEGPADVRQEAIDQFLSYRRDAFNDRYWQVVESLGKDLKRLQAVVKQVIRISPSKLGTVDRRLGYADDEERFWSQFLGMKNLPLEALQFLADKLKESKHYVKVAHQILYHPDASPAYFDSFYRVLGGGGEARFWLKEMDSPDFPESALLFLLKDRRNGDEVQRRAAKLYLKDDNSFWRRLTVFERAQALRNRHRHLLVKGIKTLNADDLVILMQRNEELRPSAWEELSSRPTTEALKAVVLQFDEHRPEAWELFKGRPDISKYDLRRIRDNVPELKDEAQQILEGIDNSHLIEEMQALSRQRY